MFKPILTAVALAVASTSMVMPAEAAPRYGYDSRGYDDGYQQVAYRRNRHYRNDNRRYGNNHRNERCYDKGNGGLAIGGIAGALAGRTIAGGGDKTLGTILGAGAGALAGRAIDKSDGARC
jgi:uncharacterized protein YcfJ